MPDKKKLALSRRQLLGGLGAVGAASAGAGLGTTALFSDEESFNNNEIQAGTTNLIVRAKVVENNIGGDGSINLANNTADSGTPVAGITVSDLKPGDSFVICTDVEVENNPMFVGVEVTETNDDEGANPEPEPQPGGDSNPNGELDEKMDVTFGYDSNANNYTWDSSITGVEFSGSAAQFMQVSQIYRGRNGDGGMPPGGHGGGSDPATRIGDGSLADLDNVTHYTKFELPSGVGNVVQGDTFEFDIAWHAEQVRNNAQPSSVDELKDGSVN